MIKYHEPNPLAVFGLREMAHCPPHFEKVPFDLKTDQRKILNWIHSHTEGRFWYGQVMSNSDSGLMTCVAFEVPAEASFFALNLMEINKYDVDYG